MHAHSCDVCWSYSSQHTELHNTYLRVPSFFSRLRGAWMRTVWFIWVPLAVAPLWQRLHVCQKMCELWGWRTWQVSGQEGCHVPSVPSLMWDSKDKEMIVCTLLNRAPFCHSSNPHHGHRVARNARRDEAHANVVRKESGRDGRGDAERPEEESWRGAAFTLRAGCCNVTC